MDIPLPPTDSLYKFVALAGLLTAIVTTYFVISLVKQLETEGTQFEIKARTLGIDLNMLYESELALKNEISNAEKSVADFKSKDAAGTLGQNDLRSPDGFDETIHRLGSKLDQLSSMFTAFQKQAAEDDVERKSLISEIDWGKQLTYMLLVVCFAGMYWCVWGFWMWYFRIQKFQDRLLQAEVMKALGPAQIAGERS